MLRLIQIAEHYIQIETSIDWIEECLRNNYKLIEEFPEYDLSIRIEDNYGRSFESFDVRIATSKTGTSFTRSDYNLEISPDYRTAQLQVHDDYALKHAMLHLYSAFIVHLEWGLLIHSSCVVNERSAYLFAGSSGAGKSTIASLSAPRMVLSDEATLVHIPKNGGVRIYNSPFRSDIANETDTVDYPLAAIHLLNQSANVYRTSLPTADVFQKLTSYVFYWAHDPKETARVIRLIEKLAQYVQAYDLYFQKNASFWGLIS